MGITKFHIVAMLLFLVVLIISGIRSDRYWERQVSLIDLGSFDIKVSKLFMNHAALSFNDSLKASTFEFNLLDTIKNEFYWTELETPFYMKKEEASDTLILIKNDNTKLRFRIRYLDE